MSEGRFSIQARKDSKGRMGVLNSLSSKELSESFQRNVVRKYIRKPLLIDTAERVILDINHLDGMMSNDLEYYYYVGYDAIRIIDEALSNEGRSISSIKTLLDFPCGYGRVTRWLKAHFPDSSLTVSDLLKSAVNFSMSRFDSNGYYSKEKVGDINLSHSAFDLIWVGSLLTHLPLNKIDDFLSLFDSLLSKNGFLFISLHGSYVANRISTGEKTYNIELDQIGKVLNDYKEIGFGFSNYKNQINYGVSILTRTFLETYIASHNFELEVVDYLERGWVNHQDIVVLRKKVRAIIE